MILSKYPNSIRFQWASLQIDQLLRLDPLPSLIRKRLGQLPKGLKEAYDEMYSEIHSIDEMGSIADRAFQWVMCSCSPLSAAELVAAVRQDPNADAVIHVDDGLDIDIILSACRNLLVVDSHTNTCRFSHLSVQEYFEEHHWSQSQAHAIVGTVCLLLLRDQELCKRDYNWRKNEHDGVSEIVHYARLHWPTHIQRHGEISPDVGLANHLKSFLGSVSESSSEYKIWYEKTADIIRQDAKEDRWNRKYQKLPLNDIIHGFDPSSNPSFAICAFGFRKILLDWWSSGVMDANARNIDNNSLLQLAAQRGHSSIVEQLVEIGAYVNAVGGEYGTALQAASCNGQDSAVRVLLDAGADVNLEAGKHSCALQAASYRGHNSTVKLLLEAGADVNLMGGVFGSALQAASLGGYNLVVELLLEAGADANLMGDIYGTALQVTSSESHYSIVKLLLEAGADVNLMGGLFGTTLQAASFGGRDSVVKLLLEAGADVNLMGGIFGTALQAASFGGRDSVVKLLLEAGADVNLMGGIFGTALQHAMKTKSVSVMQILMAAGADVNAQSRWDETAIEAALRYDKADAIIKTLLEAGARHPDPEIQKQLEEWFAGNGPLPKSPLPLYRTDELSSLSIRSNQQREANPPSDSARKRIDKWEDIRKRYFGRIVSPHHFDSGKKNN